MIRPVNPAHRHSSETRDLVYVYPTNTAGDAVSVGFDLILAC